MMVGLSLLLPTLLFQAPPEKETVQIVGTKTTFDMVKISEARGLRPFSIGTQEVTWEQINSYRFDRSTGVDAVTRPTAMDPFFGDLGVPPDFLNGKRPAVNVRWHTAAGYCEWLSRKTGRYFRLPTEKEWEFAARAGESGAGPASLDDVAWHKGNAEARTHVGGDRKANAFGLHDMLGNVWEYCLEFDSPPTLTPVLRGGSWSVPASDIKFATRRLIPDEWFESDVNRPRSLWWLASNHAEQGFRVLWVTDAATPAEVRKLSGNFPIRILESADADIKGRGRSSEPFWRVKADVTNGSGRTVDELELRIHFLKPDGSPHLTDKDSPTPGRPTYMPCWPVLASSARPAVAAPLNPGETRVFEVHVPRGCEDDAVPGKLGGSVTNLRFAKE
jgi:hypothetical protein